MACVLALLCIMAGVLVPGMLRADPPSWWAANGATVPGAEASDYAVINQGQLKNLARAATIELDNHLPNGAGTEIHNLILSWQAPDAATSDFAAVNVGQLKTVAQLFYVRLITEHYYNHYPWEGYTTPASDFALANIGQAKNVFGFDLERSTNGTLPPDWLDQWGLAANTNPDAEAADSGLTYLQKYQYGLNPLVASTAGDAFTDGWKVAHGLDPHHRMVADNSGLTLKLQVYTPLR